MPTTPNSVSPGPWTGSGEYAPSQAQTERTANVVIDAAHGIARDNGADASSLSILELGVGTGRIAKRVVAAGFTVLGIDIDDAALESAPTDIPGMQLKARSMVDPYPDGEQYALIYCIQNTFNCLLTQSSQLEALRAASNALQPGGSVLLHLLLPARNLMRPKVQANAIEHSNERLVTQYSEVNAITQSIRLRFIDPSYPRELCAPVHLRYIWPDELRLMANAAEMHVAELLDYATMQPPTNETVSMLATLKRQE